MIKFRRLIEFNGIRNYRDSALSRHRLVMSLFPQDLGENSRLKGRILFRGEKNDKESIVLIRSELAPANISGVKVLLEDYTNLAFEEHMAFRVTAAPIERTKTGETFISDFDSQQVWLENKFAGSLKNSEIILSKEESIARDNKSTLKLVQFDGVAQLEDKASLIELLSHGVGRNKNYGAGLLTIRKLK